MRQLIEGEALQGKATSQNDLAFIDSSVPDRMLFSPVISRNLTQSLAWHLAAADRGQYPVWTLADIIRVSTTEELADAEAFAREHYGPAPPPGSDPQRPVRRQRRGCRGGKGRKRHVMPDELHSPSIYSPRIMSAFNGVPNSHAAYPRGPMPPPMPPPPAWPMPTLPDFLRAGLRPPRSF